VTYVYPWRDRQAEVLDLDEFLAAKVSALLNAQTWLDAASPESDHFALYAANIEM
jgi:hypothetical protein